MPRCCGRPRYTSVSDDTGVRQLADRSPAARPDRVRKKLLPLVEADDADLLVRPGSPRRSRHGCGSRDDTRPRPRAASPEPPTAGRTGPTPQVRVPRRREHRHRHPPRHATRLDPRSPDAPAHRGHHQGRRSPQRTAGGPLRRRRAALPGNPEQATARLRALLEQIPAHERCATLAIAGVSNWHKNPEWNAFRFDDRTVLVAFDGDVHTNRQVRKQAGQLFDWLSGNKNATPMLIDLDAPLIAERATQRGLGAVGKVGLDDFFAALGDWSDLPAIITRPCQRSLGETLLRRPASSTDEGTMRVAEDRPWVTQELLRLEPGAPLVWRDYTVAARTWPAHPQRRDPPPARRIGDRLRHDLPGSRRGDRHDEHPTAGDHLRGRLVGRGLTRGHRTAEHPHHQPQRLARHLRARPRVARAQSELAADRGSGSAAPNGSAPSRRTRPTRRAPSGHGRPWAGYRMTPAGARSSSASRSSPVNPTTSSSPPASRKPSSAVPASSASPITTASSPSTCGGDQFVADARSVFDAYVTNGAWADPAYGILGIAAMLRPTLPLHPTSVIYAYGPPNSGKSHWASFVMSGWQREGGTWTGDSLPGSANDSLAAMEDSIARVPIWVADDLAPSPSRGRQESRESALTDIIRSVHNHASRRRMDGVSGRQRVTHAPTALLVITAENELDSASAIQRAVQLPFLRGVFSTDQARTTAAVQARDAHEPAASRLVAGMIRYWLMPTLPGAVFADDWAGRVEIAERMRSINLTLVRRNLEDRHGISGGEIDRQARSSPT